jgi:uncharacterized protein (TIGR03435 family)
MKFFAASLLALCSAFTAKGQNASVQLKFEVASVKRTNECGGRNYIGPGSVALRGVPLKPVLMEAFSVKIDQIKGPSWLETDCFDIDAKIPVDGDMGQIPAMLQALLTERFKLAAHTEDRTRPGYALVVDKGGPKVKEDDPKANFMRSPDGRQLWAFGLRHGGVKGVETMAGLAASLSHEGYGPVQDETGLTGKYDIDLSWTRDPDLAPRDPAASATIPPSADAPVATGVDLFAAIRALGLRLERRQVLIQFVVIDHIERIPTEN